MYVGVCVCVCAHVRMYMRIRDGQTASYRHNSETHTVGSATKSMQSVRLEQTRSNYFVRRDRGPHATPCGHWRILNTG